MQIRFLSSPANGSSLLRRLAAFIVTSLVLVLALTLSALLVVIVLVVGVLAWAYLWWKTREVRKHLDNNAARAARTRAHDATPGGMVIEGEVTRVDVA